jgi:aspartyl/asparaginyl-tRNA synthetase
MLKMETLVKKLAIIISIIGLISLFFLAEEFNPRSVESIDKPLEEVEITGKINKIVNKEKVKFLQVEGKKVENFEVVIFENQDLFIKVGDIVEISGIVEEYKGKKEIIADKIELK